MNQKELEIYIHIPFCIKKCSYCDFLSAPATEQTVESYMAALFYAKGNMNIYFQFLTIHIAPSINYD